MDQRIDIHPMIAQNRTRNCQQNGGEIPFCFAAHGIVRTPEMNVAWRKLSNFCATPRSANMRPAFNAHNEIIGTILCQSISPYNLRRGPFKDTDCQIANAPNRCIEYWHCLPRRKNIQAHKVGPSISDFRQALEMVRCCSVKHYIRTFIRRCIALQADIVSISRSRAHCALLPV